MTRKEASLRQLAVRGFGDEVERRVRALARAEGISLNEAVLRLLRRGAGVHPGQGAADVVRDSLDHLAGTWSEGDLREFTAAVRPTEQVDESFWGDPEVVRSAASSPVRVLLDTNAYTPGSAGTWRSRTSSAARSTCCCRRSCSVSSSSDSAAARASIATDARGRPIPTNDVWIAAHAMESGADLVSFDAHFAEIDGLAWLLPESS